LIREKFEFYKSVVKEEKNEEKKTLLKEKEDLEIELKDQIIHNKMLEKSLYSSEMPTQEGEEEMEKWYQKVFVSYFLKYFSLLICIFYLNDL